MTFIVYDDRTRETLFSSDIKQEAISFMLDIDEESEVFSHVWLKTIKD